MKKSLLILASTAALFFAASCGGDETTTTEAPKTENTEAKEAPKEAPAAPAEITITGDDAMKFDLSEIKVKEGQKVKLTLKHSGKQAKEAMGHNFVLLNAGVDPALFAKEATSAKDHDYIPESMKADVLAHTKVIGGGESDVIEFDAPKKGTYDFLCSFPGHSAMMKGKFIVE